MKTNSKEVESRLRRKALRIFGYIALLRKAKGISQAQLAEKMGVKESYLSRVISGLGKNVTLETLAKFEDALQTDVIVTPLHYEEHLLKNVDRIVHLASLAAKHSPRFREKMIRTIRASNDIVSATKSESPLVATINSRGMMMVTSSRQINPISIVNTEELVSWGSHAEPIKKFSMVMKRLSPQLMGSIKWDTDDMDENEFERMEATA